MSTFPEARIAITKLVLDNFTGVDVEKIQTPNDAFSPPEGEAWCRLTIREEDGAQETLGGTGSRKFARRGRIFFEIRTPLDQGTDPGDVLANEAKNVIEGKNLQPTADVWIFGATIRDQGTDGAWYVHVVEAPYESTEQK